jgi:hypothetical protein
MTTPLTHDENDEILDITPVLCDRCWQIVPAGVTETITVETAKATFSSPAEYDEEVWCRTCRERAKYEDENADYERARAQGWED